MRLLQSLAARLDRGRPRSGLRPADLAITLAHESERERLTRDALLKLLSEYDLTPWLATTRVVIDETAVPHSHPVLTLHARHVTAPDLLLSTFVHENIHWLLRPKLGAVSKAMAELRNLYPEIAVAPPAGAGDRQSSYLHLIVNYLELVAMRKLAGHDRAGAVFDVWRKHHYTQLYEIVLGDEFLVASVVERNGLLLPG
ncbi:MAG: hypothetical protein WEC75_09085 [Dehalococcoidia bacterium]